MIDALVIRPNPIAFLVGILLVSIAIVAAFYFIAARSRSGSDGRDEGAFGLGQTAIFGLIALILAFSFSFAAERYEARRALVVQESLAVGDVYARADFFPPEDAAKMRALVRDYTEQRIDIYRSEENPWMGGGPHTTAADELIERMWDLSVTVHRRDPRDLGTFQVTEFVDQVGDLADEQAAAINNHIPGPIFAIVIFCTLLGAALLGLTFGRVRSPNRALSAVFCLIFAATVYTIVDLDHVAGGLIHIDDAPLQHILATMDPPGYAGSAAVSPASLSTPKR